MKKRILKKKLKTDVLFNLWVDQWCNTLILRENLQNNYDNLTELEKTTYELYWQLDNYEYNKIYSIGRQKYHATKLQMFYLLIYFLHQHKL